MLKLYNTLTRKKEVFKSIKKGLVLMYTCGPTVYNYDHIGHAWGYEQADLLRRALEYNGYKVKQIINITDVGHLTSDADTGEDKIEKSAAEKKKTVWEIADYFAKIYYENRKKLNLLPLKTFRKATDNIKEMIKLVQILEKKGYAYKTNDGVYFSVEKFPAYGRLSGNTIEKLKAGARIEINAQKKHPADFALWKLTPKGAKRQMEWDSPWGKGFPGWHIECSAMAMKYLGETIDIHSGGEDNIFPHHESEIAQSESATGKKFVNFWFHYRFLKIEGEKMSKSLNNFFTLADVEKKGFSPIALRYLFLTGHYSSPFNFTWEGLEAAQNALNNFYNLFSELNKTNGKINPVKSSKAGSPSAKFNGVNKKYKEEFCAVLNDDLNIPEALAVAWKLIKDEKIKTSGKRKTLLDFDNILGLNLNKIKKEFIPASIKILAREREKSRDNRDWQKADELRKEIEKSGYRIEDTSKGPKLKKL